MRIMIYFESGTTREYTIEDPQSKMLYGGVCCIRFCHPVVDEYINASIEERTGNDTPKGHE